MLEQDRIPPQHPLDDMIHLLRRGREEIMHLRNVNRAMESRLKVYDNMMSLFQGGPRSGPGEGFTEDIASFMEKKATVLEYERERQRMASQKPNSMNPVDARR